MPVKVSDKLLAWGYDDIEDGTFQQAEKATKLPFIEGHIALMPDAHIGFGSTVGSVIPTRGAIIPSAIGVDIGCFVGTTRVPLLNGTQKTLKELADNDDSFYVYSINDSGQVVPGHATALKTRDEAALVKVVVSGGDEIVCTPDHLFMLTDGSYVEAKDLKFNQSLMPLYRKWQTRDGYESVSTGKGKAKLTHQLVSEYFYGTAPQGSLVHHEDHNHFNNDPSNLVWMNKKDHSSHHRKTGHSFNNTSTDFQVKRLAGIEARKNDPVQLAKMKEIGKQNITAYMKDRPEHFKEAIKDNGKRGAEYLRTFNTSPRDCDECGEESKNPATLRWHKEKVHEHNHKVLSVIKLDYTEDVYCLQVEAYNNFALAAGVFVHNCGMIAAQTNLSSHDLPEDLNLLHAEIAKAIPAGPGKGRDVAGDWTLAADPRRMYTRMSDRQEKTTAEQFGTLGGGNHFVELCLDQDDSVWLVIHSGSRGIGNQLANIHIEGAKGIMKQYFIDLPEAELAYLVEGTPQFEAYIRDMLWAQDYAKGNRQSMLLHALEVLRNAISVMEVIETVNCHHNYTEQEHHHGKNVWLTRKGAIRARVGDRGIIPGSMGTETYIVDGLGNPASYNSASHGAGRRLSRSKARKQLTFETLQDKMQGQVWNNDRDLLDEHPDAYKSIADVMEAQKDLVKITHTLVSVLNYKGVK